MREAPQKQMSRDKILAQLEHLKRTGKLNEAYKYMCERITEYKITYDYGLFYCDDTLITKNNLISIMRNDIRSRCPEMHSKTANHLAEQTLKIMIKKQSALLEIDTSEK